MHTVDFQICSYVSTHSSPIYFLVHVTDIAAFGLVYFTVVLFAIYGPRGTPFKKPLKEGLLGYILV